MQRGVQLTLITGDSQKVARHVAKRMTVFVEADPMREGIDEGRVTFANTLKCIFTTISANFGNMFSMACVSMVLPLPPLQSSQIQLNNFLSDIPAGTIASDTIGAGDAGPHRAVCGGY